MPTIEISGENLLDAVKQMPPEEFDAFIERALLLRAQHRPHPTATPYTIPFHIPIEHCQGVG
jgi:hypothetical protein